MNKRKAVVEEHIVRAYMLARYCERWAEEAREDFEFPVHKILTVLNAADDLDLALRHCLEEFK